VCWSGYRLFGKSTLFEVELFDGASTGTLNCLILNLDRDKKLGNNGVPESRARIFKR
jgi:hypothetical protein